MSCRYEGGISGVSWKNAELTIKVAELQQKVKDLNQVLNTLKQVRTPLRLDPEDETVLRCDLMVNCLDNLEHIRDALNGHLVHTSLVMRLRGWLTGSGMSKQLAVRMYDICRENPSGDLSEHRINKIVLRSLIAQLTLIDELTESL